MPSLEITPEEKRDDAEREKSILSKPSYPMGMVLRVDAETAKKLGLPNAPKLFSKVKFAAMAEVSGVRKNEEQNGIDSFSVELQLTHMDIVDAEEDKSREASNVVYG